MNCTFFGHGDTPLKTEPQLKATIIELIEQKGVNKFFVGTHGNFDRMAHAILVELTEKYPIKYYVVLAYLPKKETADPAHTLLPEGIERIPPRYTITYRNKWMLEKSDYVITYVTRPAGGAAQFKALAEKKGKIIIDCSSV